MNLKYMRTQLDSDGKESLIGVIDVDIMDTITRVVSEFTKVSIDNMKMKDGLPGARKRQYVVARQMAMFVANTVYKMGVVFPGFYFGERNHSTVIHARDTIEDLCDSNPEFYKTMEKVKNLIFIERNKGNINAASHEWINPEVYKNLSDYKASQIEQ